MKISWPTSDGIAASCQVPAHLTPFVRALGLEVAVQVFLEFGGAPLYLAETPNHSSALVAAIGRENVLKLTAEIGVGHFSRVPIDRKFLARYRIALVFAGHQPRCKTNNLPGAHSLQAHVARQGQR